MLSSLSKCLVLAIALNLVDSEIESDIRTLVKLRNMYAHGPHRTELREDDESQNLVRKLKIYRNSDVNLHALEIGNAFFCCIESIIEIVREKRLQRET